MCLKSGEGGDDATGGAIISFSSQNLSSVPYILIFRFSSLLFSYIGKTSHFYLNKFNHFFAFKRVPARAILPYKHADAVKSGARQTTSQKTHTFRLTPNFSDLGRGPTQSQLRAAISQLGGEGTAHAHARITQEKETGDMLKNIETKLFYREKRLGKAHGSKTRLLQLP
jgi:hypothetical protein